MIVSCECCVLSGEVSASDWSLMQRSPAECVCLLLSAIKGHNNLCTYND
jgi:hypothetical protein